MRLTPDQSYHVTTRHVFEGRFERYVTDDQGRKWAVFATDPAAGIKFPMSGRRKVLVDEVEVRPA